MDAIPAVPIAIIVKNGPSFNDRIEIAPASVSSPYCCASPKYNPPAELVSAAMIAIGVIPSKSCHTAQLGNQQTKRNTKDELHQC